MSEPLEELITRLRAEYLAEMPSRLAEMRRALEAWRSGTASDGPPLLTLFHRLAGSAGAYGFGDVSALCRGTEEWLAANPAPTEASVGRVGAAIEAIKAAFEKPPTTEGIEA